MDKHQRLPFEVGQLAEAKSFKPGFRGAWFRCKIKEILKKKNGHIDYLMEYYDFPDEKETWIRAYQFLPGPNRAPRQLMVRPEYPYLCHPSQLPVVGLMPAVIVMADGTWRVGDLVDWRKDDCYWSGKVTRILGSGKAEIEFPPPPMGEGSVYEVSVEILRPSLEWSPENGWLVPISTDAGSSPQTAWLIHQQANKGHLSPQMATLHKRAANNQAHTCSSAKDIMMAAGNLTSSSSHTTRPTTSSDELMSAKPEIMKESLGQARSLESNMNSVPENKCSAEAVLSNSNSGSRLGDGIADFFAAKTSGKGIDDPDFIRKRLKNNESIPLNPMHSNTIEAAIGDLEELANKIGWLKSILKATDATSNLARPVWKFIEPRASSTPK